jgi:alginate O-acetyltransferase complex protein AlgI
MLFTSTVFLFLFLPLLLLLYYIFPVRMRNGLLFLASLIFYAWGEVFYSCIILVSIGVNYGLARIMATVNAGGRRRILLGIAIAFNLLLLGWFKYANFLIDNLNHLLQLSGMPLIHLSPVHLPIGISFFTFQAMSYVIDAYFGKVMVQKRIMHLGLYISLFPQLIAGPIVRYSDIATEIAARHVNLNRFAYGIRRFIIGMGKKMILANPLGEVADNIFSLSPQEWTTPVAWIGIVCYTLQIYFDFSGYSDMAIGLGRMLGFTFKENFRYPYAAESIRGFWRRWHISLSTWFRDYLYVPLGGSHVCYLRTIFNLWIVFLLAWSQLEFRCLGRATRLSNISRAYPFRADKALALAPAATRLCSAVCDGCLGFFPARNPVGSLDLCRRHAGDWGRQGFVLSHL